MVLVLAGYGPIVDSNKCSLTSLNYTRDMACYRGTDPNIAVN